jgi:alanine dehydrogenase
MKIAIPKEIKTLEGRVGLVPEACGELVRTGHRVAVEQGAGLASGFADQAYRDQGVEILADAAAIYDFAELLVKVKEPVGPELELLQARHLLFCFLHLAALPELQQRLLAIGLTAVAFETLVDGGGLPILAPMSDIAGRLAVQIGSNLLHRPMGGKGLLLGGLPGVPRGRVVILGAGQAGGNAALVAAALGAEVTIFDKRRERLEAMRALGPNVTALYAYYESIERAVAAADLLIGAVLIPGARAPRLISAEQVAAMQAGSVLADISVDQGGCIETTRPTTYAEPTYQVSGVTHFCVTNMPGAVPRSASQALSAAVIPYLLPLAAGELERNPALRTGINVKAGALVHPALQ